MLQECQESVKSVMTLFLQCYDSVTRVSRGCYKSVISVSQDCYKSVTRVMLQEFYKSVTGALRE